MELRTQPETDSAIAVPAELDDAGLRLSQLERRLKTCFAATGMKHEIALRRCRLGQSEASTERFSQRAAIRVRIHQLDIAGEPVAGEKSHQGSDHAPAHDADAVADQRRSEEHTSEL